VPAPVPGQNKEGAGGDDTDSDDEEADLQAIAGWWNMDSDDATKHDEMCEDDELELWLEMEGAAESDVSDDAENSESDSDREGS